MRFPNGPTVWRCYLFFVGFYRPSFVSTRVRAGLEQVASRRVAGRPRRRDAIVASSKRNETKRRERERERERKEKFSRPAKRTEQHNEAISCAPGQNRFPWPVFFLVFFFEVLKRDFLCDRNGFATECTEFFFLPHNRNKTTYLSNLQRPVLGFCVPGLFFFVGSRTQKRRWRL